MTKKISHDEWLNSFTNDLVNVIGKYTNKRTPILVECVVCGHHYTMYPDSIRRGSGHDICSRHTLHKKMQKTHAEYLQSLKDANITDIIPIDSYSGFTTPIKHKHTICGKVSNKSPASVLAGKGCIYCSHIYSVPKDEYLDMLVNTEFELIGEYQGYTTKTEHKHTICGHVRLIEPSAIIKRGGCPKCANVIKRTSSRYEEEIRNHGFSLIDDYNGMHTPVMHKCMICDYERLIRPNDIINNGVGCIKCNGHISNSEKEIVDYIKSIYSGTIIENTRSIIPPYELDIYIPEHKLAIEFNGLYWHSELRKDKNYHYKKWKLCNTIGIQLFQIYEDDWHTKINIWKKKLDYMFNKANHKVYARKCNIINVSSENKKHFFDMNHLQGNGISSINIGLMYDNELVACMGFKSRGNDVYELTRYATSCVVIGGFSKLLKSFKLSYSWTKLITFADLTVSDGKLYDDTGWICEKYLKPDYMYILGKNRKHKFNFRHKQLKSILDHYDASLSEHQNLLNHGIYRIYNAGLKRYAMCNV